MEKLALVQLQHLPAPVLHVRDERTFPGIEAVGHIRSEIHQKSLQGLTVRPPPAQEAESLEDEILPVVVRIVDSEINEFHSIRERIECRPAFLVRRSHDYPERPLLRMLKQPANLVQKNPFHPAGIVEGVYAKQEGHCKDSLISPLPCSLKQRNIAITTNMSVETFIQTMKLMRSMQKNIQPYAGKRFMSSFAQATI